MSIKGGHIEVSVDIDERGTDWLRTALISVGVVLCVALVYQMIVGGIKIEAASGRLIIDAGGLAYWWQSVTHH